MTEFAEDAITRDVRVALDENTEMENALADDTGALEMDDVIRSKIADALNAVRKAAALATLVLSKAAPDVAWLDEAKGIGCVELPADFLRLALFKMSDWPCGVSVAISPASPLYRRQWSRWAGVRGNPSRPVVALSGDIGDGGRGTLEFFSSGDTSQTAQLLYVPRAVRADTYKVEDGLYRAVALKAAALTAAAYGNTAAMQLLDALAKEQME